MALQHLRNLKVQKCTEDLVNMGFKKGASEMAKNCGGELQLAVEHLSEGAWLLRLGLSVKSQSWGMSIVTSMF